MTMIVGRSSTRVSGDHTVLCGSGYPAIGGGKDLSRYTVKLGLSRELESRDLLTATPHEKQIKCPKERQRALLIP